VDGAFSAHDLKMMGQAWERHIQMMRAYEPGSYRGDALFFTATRQRPEGTPTYEVWHEPSTLSPAPALFTRFLTRRARR